MKKILYITALAGALSGCFLMEDYPANLAKLDGDLTYICTTGINAVRNGPDYQSCRLYYDKLLLQYDMDLSAPTAWSISKFEDRTMPLLNRCRRYANTPVAISACLQEQENLMLAEWTRQKFLREEQEAKKELIRERERERDRHERDRRHEEERRERERMKNQPKGHHDMKPHNDRQEMRRDDKRPNDRDNKRNDKSQGKERKSPDKRAEKNGPKNPK